MGLAIYVRTYHLYQFIAMCSNVSVCAYTWVNVWQYTIHVCTYMDADYTIPGEALTH